MAVQPYVLTSQAVLSQLQQRIAGRVGQWCTDWGVAPDAVTVTCQRAWEAGAPSGTAEGCMYQSQDKLLGLWTTLHCAAGMQKLLFSVDHRFEGQSMRPESMAAHVAREALQALQQVVRDDVLGIASVEQAGLPPAQGWRPGAGSVLVCIAIEEHALFAWMNLASVADLAPAPVKAALPPIAAGAWQRALAPVAVRLPVEIGAAVIDVAGLLSLAVGDVIRLDALLERPVPVKSVTGEMVCGAYLGRVGEHMAIEVCQR